MSDILDPILLDVLDDIAGISFSGSVWRVSWKYRDPLVSSPGGGRWAPNSQFDVLYTSLSEDGAMAEVYHHLSRAPVFSSSEKTINKIAVSLTNLLPLDQEIFERLKIENPLSSKNLAPNQAVGEAAYMLGFKGLIVPSARYDCKNLVIFTDQLDASLTLEVEETKPINWPAWKERQP